MAHKLAILSRNRNLHSIRRLLAEARKRRIECDVIDPLDCQMVVDGPQSSILLNGRRLPEYDAVLPRIGASITEYGLAVVRQFEILGMLPINGSQAIAESRDKLRSLQILSEAGLRVPATVLNRDQRNVRAAMEAVSGLPAVLKLLKGTQGVGVMLVHSPISLRSVIDTMHLLDQDVLVQRFIAEGAGRDFRAIVVGDRVVGAMMRTAPEGEFRSNIHRGGEGSPVDLPRATAQVAVRAARILGLEIAGVDLMESSTGPLVIEVNSSPGFEGIEKATKLNVARLIIDHACRMIRQNKSRRRRRGQTRPIGPRFSGSGSTRSWNEQRQLIGRRGGA
jgi:ribosomal protein S6--L-glutamate ligase